MLVAMCGFDLEDCIFALKRNKDQIDRAADWILDKDAPRILQAERVSPLVDHILLVNSLEFLA